MGDGKKTPLPLPWHPCFPPMPLPALITSIAVPHDFPTICRCVGVCVFVCVGVHLTEKKSSPIPIAAVAACMQLPRWFAPVLAAYIPSAVPAMLLPALHLPLALQTAVFVYVRVCVGVCVSHHHNNCVCVCVCMFCVYVYLCMHACLQLLQPLLCFS